MIKWKNRKELNTADILTTAKKYNITPAFAAILLKRDIVNINKYLSPSDCSYSSELLFGACKAAELINEAIHNRKKICIVNDYDIDGIASGIIMYKSIIDCGGIEPIIIPPHRLIDGYGISKRIIDLAKESGSDFIVTTDNGIAAQEQIAYAKKLGFTVVITDHHEIPSHKDEFGNIEYSIPDADVVVNPKLPFCKYPFKDICGATVAYKVADLLLSINITDEQERKNILTSYQELVAIATIGDVMPLLDENRYFVSKGLDLIKNSAYQGLIHLINEQSLNIEKLNAYSIGYSIGPCLNAPGRMTGGIEESLNLFLEKEDNKCIDIAKKLKQYNDDRKNECEQAEKKAIDIASSREYQDDNILVIYIPNILESLCGIIAGRLKDTYNKPALVFTDSTLKGILKGSGRSFYGYHMFNSLSMHRDLFTAFGGHELAAGFSIKSDNLSILRSKLNEDSKDLDFSECNAKIIDLFISMSDVSIKLAEELQLMEPCGQANEKAVFCDEETYLFKVKYIGQNNQYLKLYFTKEHHISEALYFGNKDLFIEKINDYYGKNTFDKLLSGSSNAHKMDVIYKPTLNTWNGVTSVNYIIDDFLPH